MTKRPLLGLLLKFVAITLPLTWLWMNGGQDAYFSFYMDLVRPILRGLGVTSFSPGLVRDRMIGFVPFLALMLVTPQLTPRRRFGGIAIGVGVLFVSHIALTYWAWATFVRDGATNQSMMRYFPALIVSDALPFLLWAVFANRLLSELIARVLPASAFGPQATSQPAASVPSTDETDEKEASDSSARTLPSD